MAGTLVIIGGHEDRKEEKKILSEVVERGGRRRIVLVGTASEDPKSLFEEYQKAFHDLGVRDIVTIGVTSREEYLREEAAEPLKHASVVFFTGGDQLRLTSQLGDTPVYQGIKRIYADGGVIAGTSAGASVLCDTMLVFGESASSPRVGEAIRMAPGFGLIKHVIIDQHFAERGRMGRLLAAVAQNPASLGLGIDENTAVVAERQRFEVIGAGGVYAVDASGVTYSSVAEKKEDMPVSLHDVKVHLLAPGDRFDLKARRPIVAGNAKE
jgi:cyanophycinase